MCHQHPSVRHSHALKRNPVPTVRLPASPNSPQPWPPPAYFLSPWICQFWTFHINGITVCGLCIGLPPLGTQRVPSSFVLWGYRCILRPNRFPWVTTAHSVMHSSANGYLGFLHSLPPVTSVAINTCVRVFVRTYVFRSLGHLPRRRSAGSYRTLCLTLSRTIFQSGCTLVPTPRRPACLSSEPCRGVVPALEPERPCAAPGVTRPSLNA